MPHIVCEPCKNCKFTDCVEVCPVDCFHEAPDILWIDPDTCIDCELCVPECPVEAIFAEDDVPEQWKDFIKQNADNWEAHPVITEKQDPMPGAEEKRKK